jgi:hypothetical protein
MEVKDTSLSEISGESGIFCTVVALASAEFADSCGILVQPKKVYVVASSNPVM